MDRNPDNNKQIVKALIIDPNIAKKSLPFLLKHLAEKYSDETKRPSHR